MNSGLSQNLIPDSEQLTHNMEGSRQRAQYPCVIIRPFIREPQNTQSREPDFCVFEQHEGLVATKKVGV